MKNKNKKFWSKKTKITALRADAVESSSSLCIGLGSKPTWKIHIRYALAISDCLEICDILVETNELFH